MKIFILINVSEDDLELAEERVLGAFTSLVMAEHIAQKRFLKTNTSEKTIFTLLENVKNKDCWFITVKQNDNNPEIKYAIKSFEVEHMCKSYSRFKPTGDQLDQFVDHHSK
jgi:hypothetical protein